MAIHPQHFRRRELAAPRRPATPRNPVRNTAPPPPPASRNIKGLSIRRMVANSLKVDLLNTEQVTLASIKMSKRPLLLGRVSYPVRVVLTKTVTRVRGEPARTYMQEWRAADPTYAGDLKTCPAVIVYCPCERFKFVYDYALFRKNASELRSSLPSAPTMTNPTLKSGLCKHCLVGAKAILERGY